MGGRSEREPGLSPLARGKLTANVSRLAFLGPIPAGAGETHEPGNAPGLHGAYPRWRGGNNGSKLACGYSGGLSPLARGKLRAVARDGEAIGPIPAGAGETRCAVPGRCGSRAYPRWRGGNRLYRWRDWLLSGLSPLARGKQIVEGRSVVFVGPIPAGAGETRRIQ